MSDKIAERIALLLNKAESTTPEEAEALTEAAEKLMVKYMIDQSVIDARRAKKGEASEKIVTKHITFKGAYRGELLHLSSMVVHGLGTLRAMQSTAGGKFFTFYLVGFESDVAQAEILINSLQLQAVVAVREFWKQHKDEYSWESSYNQEKARRSFVHGFGTGVYTRLAESRKTIIQEASSGTELVLVDRKSQVDEYMDTLKTGKGRSRNATAGGAANGQGYAAGRQANTGGTAVGRGRGIER